MLIDELPAQERKRLLAKIHLAKKQLGLSDKSYRDVLQQVTGKRSAADLDGAGLNAVLHKFKRMGFKTRISPRSSDKPQKTQVDKIRALWINLFQAGKLEDGSEPALNNFCKHQYGCDRVEWLNRRQRNACIEALKAWLAREPQS